MRPPCRLLRGLGVSNGAGYSTLGITSRLPVNLFRPKSTKAIGYSGWALTVRAIG